MSHTLHSDDGWWECQRCHDRWTQPPTDHCDELLTLLEVEQITGWEGVSPLPEGPLGRILALISGALTR